jgi:hypothetical protein
MYRLPGFFNGGRMNLTVSLTKNDGDGFSAGLPLALTGSPGRALDRRGLAAAFGNDGAVLWKRPAETAEMELPTAYFTIKSPKS